MWITPRTLLPVLARRAFVPTLYTITFFLTGLAVGWSLWG